ncbi:MAG: hypothetical protein PQJ47_03835 [Sphaerochaetaceae bacterium]|nr:hypothetical protein [Sphaerochaetaceae bacterium]MDC7247282.1 hypothetical protein [Sphaerochaetaceae bacterium]
MNITKETSHKVLLVTKQDERSVERMFAPLDASGMKYTIISSDALENDEKIVRTPLLFIRTSSLNQQKISKVLTVFPELTGVMFIFDTGSSSIEMMREIAVARTNFIAVVGALFTGGQESRGIQLCRQVGIPYLSHMKREEDRLPDPTVTIFDNMINR